MLVWERLVNMVGERVNSLSDFRRRQNTSINSRPITLQLDGTNRKNWSCSFGMKLIEQQFVVDAAFPLLSTTPSVDDVFAIPPK